MSKKMTIKTPLLILILIAVLALGWYFYFLTKQNNKEKDIDLFSFVPQDVMAIWETDNIYEVATSMKRTSYYSNYDSLHISEIQRFLIKNIDEIADIKTHGINKNTNQIIISFHFPNTARNQVLFSQLGSKQREEIEKQIRRNIPRSLQPKTLNYRNEEIIIYPIKSDDFIACYYNPDFLAISFQEKLIEDVIDTYLDKTSVLTDSIFTIARENKKGHAESTFYLKTYPFLFEKDQNLLLLTKENPAQWVEYDVKVNRDAIYLSGTIFTPDSTHSINNIIKEEIPIQLLPSNFLPENTFFYKQIAASDPQNIISLLNGREYHSGNSKNFTERTDSALFVFLKNNVDSLVSSIMFTSNTINKQKTFSSIIYIPVKNKQTAENNFRRLQTIWLNQSGNKNYIYPKYHFSNRKTYLLYQIPAFTLLDKLINPSKENAEKYYACFHNEGLLLSHHDSAITQYIDLINKGETKENDVLYQESIAGLSTESNITLLTDLGKVIEYKDDFQHIIPNLFLENDYFFKNFILTVQYIHNKEKVSPNISLIYKGEE